jgi:hypothetical protein
MIHTKILQVQPHCIVQFSNPKALKKKLSKLLEELYKQGNNVAPKVLSTRFLKKKKTQKTILHNMF